MLTLGSWAWTGAETRGEKGGGRARCGAGTERYALDGNGGKGRNKDGMVF